MMELISELFSLILKLVDFLLHRSQSTKEIYRLFGKTSKALEPKTLLFDKRFVDYYHSGFREFNTIKSAFELKRNVLVLGESLSGKTRLVYEVLKHSKTEAKLYVFNKNARQLGAFEWPISKRNKKHNIFVIDDLHNFVRISGYDNVLRQILEFKYHSTQRVQLIATCRNGAALEEVRNKLLNDGLNLVILFIPARDCILEIAPVDQQTIQIIAKELGINDGTFDGTIGSLLEPLTSVEQRYANTTEDERRLLRAAKDLYRCGLYEGSVWIPERWLFLAGRHHGLTSRKIYRFLLESLAHNGFLQYDPARHEARFVETYLEHVVRPPIGVVERDLLWLANDIRKHFGSEPGALLSLGDRIVSKFQFTPYQDQYTNTAIETFEIAVHAEREVERKSIGKRTESICRSIAKRFRKCRAWIRRSISP